MKRGGLATILMLLAVCLFATVGWMLFMGSLNSQVTTITFRVSGSIDEVLIYRETDPSTPVEVIRTQGRDLVYKVKLPKAANRNWLVQSPPAHYFFVTRSGEREYRSPQFCCQVGMKPEQYILKIHSLDNWEIANE